MRQDIADLIEQSAAIPSVPQVVVRFLEITQDPQFDYGKLVDLLASDPGMTGEILRLANSALFGVSRQITSIRQAMTLLGVRRIRSLVLTRYLISVVNDRSTVLDVRYFWRRSLTSAALAAKLARHRLASLQEETFVAALLADVGIVLMAKALGEDYRPVAERYVPGGADETVSLEQERFDTTHGEVTALLLDRWQLPALIIDTVKHHHGEPPADAEPNVRTMVQLVSASDGLAKRLCESHDAASMVDACHRCMEAAGINVSLLPTILEELEEDIADLARVLRVAVLPDRVYERIVHEIREHLSAPAGESPSFWASRANTIL
ncbi:MAG TPA: HDOD domain-containing protein [Phycisphaerae bacterium]|nr:HDOD domain-containing protein [Phycisphaerae bacterium]